MKIRTYKQWRRLTDEQREKLVATAIIHFGYTLKDGSESFAHFEAIMYRLDEYETIIRQLTEQLYEVRQ